MSPKAISALIIAIVITLFGTLSIGQLVENLDASDVMVIQSPIAGTLTVYTEPGLKWQGFGTVTKYPRRALYSFTGPDAKRVRFNDGGHANLNGSVSWETPLNPPDLIAMHKSFHSLEGVEQQAVGKMIDNAIYLAGPLMSSTESSGERRADLVLYINDQAENGVYVTRSTTKDIVDPLTNEHKETIATEIVLDAKGMPKRQQGSLLADYKIKLLPVSIKELDYDPIVEDQIKQRQKATTQVQIAQANARRAEQDAITTAKQGEANAAEAKWKQETIKAQAIVEAQQQYEVAEKEASRKLRVAELAAKEAEQYKAEQILRGSGDAERKKLVMAADGALDPKLKAYVEVNARYAQAIADCKSCVPQLVMGSTGSGSSNAATGAQALIDMFTAKTAKDLSLSMDIGGNTAQRASAQ